MVWKMTSLKQNTLLREIPDNLLVDPKVERLAKSLQQSLDAMLSWSDKINYTMHLENLDDAILDHLLWEKHITFKEGLSLVTNRSHKIALIKNAIKLHRIKGTPAAVELIFSILNLDAKINEWFEHGGDPYTFRLSLNASQRGLSESDYNALEMLLFEYKNVRSWMEKLTIYLNQHFVTANTLSVNDTDNTSVGIQVGSDGTVKLSGTAKSRITGYCTFRVVQ